MMRWFTSAAPGDGGYLNVTGEVVPAAESRRDARSLCMPPSSVTFTSHSLAPCEHQTEEGKWVRHQRVLQVFGAPPHRLFTRIAKNSSSRGSAAPLLTSLYPLAYSEASLRTTHAGVQARLRAFASASAALARLRDRIQATPAHRASHSLALSRRRTRRSRCGVTDRQAYAPRGESGHFKMHDLLLLLLSM